MDLQAEELCDPVFGQIERPSQDKRQQATKPNSRKPAPGYNFSVHSPETDMGRGAKPKRGYSVDSRKDSLKCLVCDKSHRVSECHSFRDTTPQARMNIAKQKRLCFNCLDYANHGFPQCKRSAGCGMHGCNMRHSVLLHDALTAPKDSPAVQCDTDNGYVNVTTMSTAIKSLCSVSDKPAEGSLPIVPVIVRGPEQDKYLQTYALLDSGSSNTFCSTELVSKLGLKGKDTRLTLETVNQESDINVSELSLVVSREGIPKRKRKSITLSRVYALNSFPRLRKTSVSEGHAVTAVALC